MMFSELARRVMQRTSRKLAGGERGDHPGQRLEIIPGMPSAPEPCCLPGGHWTEDTHPKDAIAQIKVDGIRALCLQTRIVTRQALPLDAALHCLPALVRLEKRFGVPMVFDGEYQETSGFNATLSAHKRGIGEGVFYLFDAVPYAEWKANRFTQPLRQRLTGIGDLMPDDEPFLCFLHPTDAPNAALALDLAGRAWARAGEGLVVKAGGSLYTRGRSKDWLKLKRKRSLDGMVLDVVVADGVPERAVALVRLEGRTHKVAAMPSDLQHLAWLDHVGKPGGLTGRMVEVEFNEHTETGALRGAHIVRLRPDKDEREL